MTSAARTEPGQRRRLRVALVVGAILLSALYGYSGFAVRQADGDAERVEGRLQLAVSRVSPEQARFAAANGVLARLRREVGGDLDFSPRRSGETVFSLYRSSWWYFWEGRCLIAVIGTDGRTRTSVRKSIDCDPVPPNRK